MRFPVDTSKVQLIGGGDPVPSVVFDTGAQRTNKKGEPLFQVELMVGGEDKERPLMIVVRTPVEPKGVGFATPVRAVGLCVVPWQSKTGNGVNYEAERVETLRPERAAS